MYLKSISVKNFKKFIDFTAAFPTDITVVKGPNEQGKSSLLSAILAGFFFDSKKSNKDILALKAWNSDKLYEIVMRLEHNGESIVLSKNFETKELLLENETKGTKLTTFDAISDYLFEIGALRSLPLFEHTACVRHDALSQMTEGKREISQALQELLTSSGENVSSDKVLKKITALITDLSRGVKQQAKNPGPIKKIELDIAELAKRKEALMRELHDIAERSVYLGELFEKHQVLSQELLVKRKQHEKNIAYFRTMEELKKLHAQLDRLDADYTALKEVEGAKERIRKQLAAYTHMREFDMQKWYAQKEAINEKKAKLASVESEAAELKKRHKVSRAHVKPGHLVLSLMLFAAGFAGLIDTRLYFVWVLAAGAFIYSFVLKRGVMVHTQKGVSSEKDELAHEIAVLEKQQQQILDANDVKNEDELIVKARAYSVLAQEFVKLEWKEGGILRSQTAVELEKERREAAKHIGIEEAKISDEEKAVPPNPADQRSLEVDIERMAKEEEKLRREAEQVNVMVHSSQADKETLAALEEDIAYAEMQKAGFERKARMLMLVAQMLEEAQKSTIEKSRRAIEEYMKKYLLVITDGRYDNVRVRDDLSFEVWSEEKKGMVVPEEHLSKGTIDQFYLIARFAVLDLLNKGIKSLMLLDDPFAGFDAKRRERAREMLEDMTSQFQIILFTHSADYAGWGSVVEI